MTRAAILILLLTACAPTREGTYAAHGAEPAPGSEIDCKDYE
jgi:hypothetical protein